MNVRHFLTTTAVASLLLAIGVAVSPSLAVQQQGTGQALEIAPPVLNISADPGETVKGRISLRDVASTKLVVTNEINDFIAEGEDGTPKILLDGDDGDSPYSLKQWIAPLPQFTLVPRQIVNLPITIRVPASAAPGGYYAVVRFTGTAPGIDGSGVSLSASLGALVLLKVNGDVREGMAIEEFKVTTLNNKANWLFESTPIRFVERLKNTGSIHLQPQGQITVKDMFGQKIAAVNVNLLDNNVLPRSIRKFDQTLDKTVIGDRMLFGYYTADLNLTYGSDDQTLTKTIGFWVIPYKLIGLGIIALIGLVVGIRIFFKRYTKRVLRNAQRSRRRRR